MERFPTNSSARHPCARRPSQVWCVLRFSADRRPGTAILRRSGKRLAERFGEGRVEVLNLGVPSSNSWTSLVLMRNYLPRWKPHLAVPSTRGSTTKHTTPPGREPWSSVPAAPISSWPHRRHAACGASLAPHSLPSSRPPSRRSWRWDSSTAPEDAWWSMARLAWANGTGLVFSTFTAPD